jgi:hypothetical protein
MLKSISRRIFFFGATNKSELIGWNDEAGARFPNRRRRFQPPEPENEIYQPVADMCLLERSRSPEIMM